MKVLIKNCTLISMSDKREKVEKDIDVLIVDNTISKIDKNIKENEIDKIIDAKGKVLMPGLINCHSHVAMSIFRESVDGHHLQDWLENIIWPVEDKLQEKDIYNASLLSFVEMIETGTTTVNDMYFFADETIKAAKEIGVRLFTTRVCVDLGGKEDGQARINEILRLKKDYKDEELISINVALHGFYTSSKEYAREVINFARDNNMILHAHFCENEQEVKDIEKAYNMKPIEILEDYLNNKDKVVLVHCVELSKNDIERISKIDSDISICTNPVSNLKLGCGIANINEMLDKNINVCIGTDGQGSGCSLDMFEQMKLIPLLQKGINKNPTLISAYEVLKMATINGAKALGLENKVGSIEEGKRADIILVDIDDTLTIPVNNIFAQLVYNIKGNNVVTTIINGKIVMENRVINNINKDSIINNIKNNYENLVKY